MKIIYLSGGIDPKIIKEIVKKYGLKTYGYAQQWWDYSMLKGLYNNMKNDLYCISVPPIPTFPSSKCIILPTINIENNDNIKILNGINLPILKQISFTLKLVKLMREIILQNTEEQIIILSSFIYYYFAKPAFYLRRKYANVKVVTFVPDLPDFYSITSYKNHIFLKIFFYIFKRKCISIKKDFDGYLCFSSYQMKYLNNNKPFCIIDGIFDKDNIKIIDDIQVDKDNSILYAGGVNFRYGIKELVDGFIQSKLQDKKLLIYGDGDAIDYVKNKEQYNVFYCGTVDRNIILMKEKESVLLINPRPIDEEFSKSSFPSKLIEYMASGTTVLTSRLKCITKEYVEYMLFIDDVSASGISKALIKYFTNYESNKKIGIKAKDYIRKYKNETYQAAIAIDFIKCL